MIVRISLSPTYLKLREELGRHKQLTKRVSQLQGQVHQDQHFVDFMFSTVDVMCLTVRVKSSFVVVMFPSVKST